MKAGSNFGTWLCPIVISHGSATHNHANSTAVVANNARGVRTTRVNAVFQLKDANPNINATSNLRVASTL